MLSATVAGAGTLGLNVDASVEITGAAEVSNDPFGFGLTVFGDGAATGTGFSGDPTGIALVAFGLVEVPPYEGNLTLSDFTDDLFGDLIDAGFTGTDAVDGTDVIELLFGNLSGAFAAAFGSQALLTMVGEFGATPFESAFYDPAALATLNPVAPVPLPATLPLLAAALAGGAALLRRGRRA